MKTAPMHIETRHFNQTRLQKEIEEEIDILEDSNTQNKDIMNGL